jgi:hypothetical protein
VASIPFNQDFRPGLIKTSDPDQSCILTRINHDFKPIQLWLQSLRINTSDPDQSRLQTDQLWLQSFLIKTSDPDKSKLLTRINHDFKPIQLWLQSLSIKISDPD